MFAGHLDTQTLGGAGFAAQFSPTGKGGGWDLTGYEGMEVRVGEQQDGDEKGYTLVLKDASSVGGDEYGVGEESEDGNGDGKKRKEASLSWEVEFHVGKGEENGEVVSVWLPWTEFKATYRGRKVDGGGEWKGGQVTRVGLMMRRQVLSPSFFGNSFLQAKETNKNRNMLIPPPPPRRSSFAPF